MNRRQFLWAGALAGVATVGTTVVGSAGASGDDDGGSPPRETPNGTGTPTPTPTEAVATPTSDWGPSGSVAVPGAAETVLAPDGETAFVAVGDGFAVLDLSDPTEPTVLARETGISPPGTDCELVQAFDVKHDDGELLLAGPASYHPDSFRGVVRYDVTDPDVAAVVADLDEGGWEVGLHGSYDSYDDESRLRMEKVMLESALGEAVTGGRQHHLNRGPETWDHHREIGLRYDASPGSSETVGFEEYRPFRPFGDEFVVFPLTVMECALPDPGEDFEAAWRECEDLLVEAAENDAVMSALWHPRLFNSTDFPGYRRLYRRLVETALEMGAWVG